MAADQRNQGLGVEEFLLHKLPQILADAVLITGNNRRVPRNERERDAAKQRHHREPVRQGTDHRRLGNGFDPADPKTRRQEEGDDERGGRDQQ